MIMNDEIRLLTEDEYAEYVAISADAYPGFPVTDHGGSDCRPRSDWQPKSRKAAFASSASSGTGCWPGDFGSSASP